MQANPPQLHSNLLYIQRFRHQSRLAAEAAYYFTNMLSAESFISNIDAKAISMDEVEFERNMEFARALLSSGISADTQDPGSPYQNNGQHPKSEATKHRALNDNKDPAQRTASSVANSESKKVTFADELSITKVPSLSELENKGASMILKEDKLNEVFGEFPYLFASVGDLTVGDVEDLLNNYKQLVFKYVSLSKGLGVSPTSHPPSNPQKNAEDHAEIAIGSSDGGPQDDNNKSEESIDTTDDSSDKVSLIEEKKIESGTPQDELVAPEGHAPS